MDKDRTWDQVDEILLLLDNSCSFLDFPSDHELNKHKLVRHGSNMVN